MNKKIEIESFKVEKKISALLLEKAESVGDDGKVYLLSFHDDGVVWGKVKNQTLITSDFKDSPSTLFRPETLQELRLFGEKGQLHIWRTGETEFKGCLALEDYLKDFEPIEEKQVLHGTRIDTDENGKDLSNVDFMIVRDGLEGLRHAFPVVDKSKFGDQKRPLRLLVKHYVEYDEDGAARIAYSRLANVSVE